MIVGLIGKDVLYKTEKYHVQDTNFLTLQAKIGKEDNNGLVWDTFWVDVSELKEI